MTAPHSRARDATSESLVHVPLESFLETLEPPGGGGGDGSNPGAVGQPAPSPAFLRPQPGAQAPQLPPEPFLGLASCDISSHRVLCTAAQNSGFIGKSQNKTLPTRPGLDRKCSQKGCKGPEPRLGQADWTCFRSVAAYGDATGSPPPLGASVGHAGLTSGRASSGLVLKLSKQHFTCKIPTRCCIFLSSCPSHPSLCHLSRGGGSRARARSGPGAGARWLPLVPRDPVQGQGGAAGAGRRGPQPWPLRDPPE